MLDLRIDLINKIIEWDKENGPIIGLDVTRWPLERAVEFENLWHEIMRECWKSKDNSPTHQ